MKIENAIKKLKKLKLEIKNVEGYNFYSVENEKRVLSFYKNGSMETITCINVRGKNDHSDPQSDYCAGSFYDNLTQALKSFNRN